MLVWIKIRNLIVIPNFPNALGARNDFLSGLEGVGTEDFESFSVGEGVPLDLNFPGSSGDIMATLSGGGGDIQADSSSVGRVPTSGDRFLEVNAGGNFTADFSSAIAAFGFYGVDLA